MTLGYNGNNETHTSHDGPGYSGQKWGNTRRQEAGTRWFMRPTLV
ncbi:hypothetical protein E2C01_094752 [Portunus trituberculatus]|uniref:Uncharacterized protein n=1 Tax=Portunus trituberculatus TaxID=210409 RepID=A0A5B7JY20_PORTR|nr:hypothetical protein [Portunus trituberculatus]